MDYDGVIKVIQQHFTDGLVLVVGSGLSAAEGIPGMAALASHLKASGSVISGSDEVLWQKIIGSLDAGEGLEAALLKTPPSQTLEAWIIKTTCEVLIPAEKAVIQSVIKREKVLRLTSFLTKVLRPTNGLPILSPNYDRLIEVACEMAGFHVDSTAVGHYAGSFDPVRSCMGSCRGIVRRGKADMLDHFPRAIVLKPHGSFDWYKSGTTAIRSTMELEVERLIITPGLNKYKAGYDIPFDKHRELANNHIDQSARLLIIGYGFNDDHLQKHLVPRILKGTPTIILTRTASETALKLAAESPQCMCLSKAEKIVGTLINGKGFNLENDGPEIWDLGVLTKELL